MLATLLAAATLFGVYATTGWYAFSVISNRGMTTWTAVSPGDSRLSPSMRLALRTPPPPFELSAVSWKQAEPGLEVSEIAVLADGAEVDRLLLTRISPDKFSFEVLNDPTASRDVNAWQMVTGAAVVINGSYYGTAALPDTPVISNGRRLGPESYDAKHGAFVSDGVTSRLIDLANADWRQAFSGASNAFVSYPLLLDAEGRSRAENTDDRKLANRSFIAEDSQRRIVLGTTTEAFLSLKRLAILLHQAPLDLIIALNLDGGPPACQAVVTQVFTRSFCGKWETQVHDGQIVLLGHLVGEKRWPLPMAIIAKRKS